MQTPYIRCDLTLEEAGALRALLEHVGGSPYAGRSRRALTDNVLEGLENAFLRLASKGYARRVRCEDIEGSVYFKDL